MPASPSWPGYAPWAGVVSASRDEFVRVARSFWLIPELIPPVAREDIALLYCFCRHLDDAVDEAPNAAAAQVALERWRREFRGLEPRRPLIAAFLAGVPRTGLPLAAADHLFDGMTDDLGRVRIADDDELLRYAYRVSASVGLMLAPLLGVRSPGALHRVVDLGLALQLSNVVIGVEGDARRGRVYLPATRLAAVGLEARDVLQDPLDSRLLPVLKGLADLAGRYYLSAELGAATVPLRYRHGVVLLGRVYSALGRQRARGRPAPGTPAGLSVATRVRHLAQLFLTAGHPRTLGVVGIPSHDASLHRPVAGWPGANG